MKYIEGHIHYCLNKPRFSSTASSPSTIFGHRLCAHRAFQHGWHGFSPAPVPASASAIKPQRQTDLCALWLQFDLLRPFGSASEAESQTLRASVRSGPAPRWTPSRHPCSVLFIWHPRGGGGGIHTWRPAARFSHHVHSASILGAPSWYVKASQCFWAGVRACSRCGTAGEGGRKVFRPVTRLCCTPRRDNSQ